MESHMLAKQEELQKLMQEVLQERYVSLRSVQAVIYEDIRADQTRIECRLLDDRLQNEIVIEGRGVGAVDALFQGLKDYYAAEHLSLHTISFYDFAIRGQQDTGRHAHGADAKAEAVVRIRNSYGSLFQFNRTSRSLIRASLQATLDAAEYFINSERATVLLHTALQHARAAGRDDTVADYTAKLARLVENASYTDVIEKIRKTL